MPSSSSRSSSAWLSQWSCRRNSSRDSYRGSTRVPGRSCRREGRRGVRRRVGRWRAEWRWQPSTCLDLARFSATPATLCGPGMRVRWVRPACRYWWTIGCRPISPIAGIGASSVRCAKRKVLPWRMSCGASSSRPPPDDSPPHTPVRLQTLSSESDDAGGWGTRGRQTQVRAGSRLRFGVAPRSRAPCNVTSLA